MGDLPRKMLVRVRKRTTREVRAQTAHSKRGRVRKRTTQKVRAQRRTQNEVRAQRHAQNEVGLEDTLPEKWR